MTSGPASAWVPEAFILGWSWARVGGGEGSPEEPGRVWTSLGEPGRAWTSPDEPPVGEDLTSSIFCTVFLSTSHTWNCFLIFSVLRKGVGWFYWMVYSQGLVNTFIWFLQVSGLKSGGSLYIIYNRTK